jgi:integrase
LPGASSRSAEECEKARLEVDPQSRAGRRSVTIVGALRDTLVNKASQNRSDGLVFGGDAPFQPSSLRLRAQRAWSRADLELIGLHEARHTFASVLIAAGVNAKAITTYMGHASIQTTYHLYGKLMPGSEAEAATLVGAYLGRRPRRGRQTAA